jgi:antitoxin component of MazEF toxin-antitoxin module
MNYVIPYVNLLLAMARMKAGKQHIRKLTRLGKGSLGVTIPIELTRALGWKEKQKVTVKKIKGALVVRDWKNRKKS